MHVFLGLGLQVRASWSFHSHTVLLVLEESAQEVARESAVFPGMVERTLYYNRPKGEKGKII